ncbi:ABC transporter permease [Bacillus sp. Marseille-P3661]|uniref:ABC transporter permease n=1 Tax=Bacillus sp. Marseille-P3661 TaxID=1936234 RepID=UPI0015E179EF|nr:ABC transporter permease [Bacillus sp. Marseille-P3661]
MAQSTTVKQSTLSLPNLWKYSGYIVFILVALFFSLSTSTFLTYGNIINILVQSSALGVAACGITAILIGGGNHVIRGGMDLSIANNLALNTAVIAVLLQSGFSFWTAVGLSLLCSVAVGIVNAIVVVHFKVIPLLATLAMMYLLQGVELLLTKNTVVSIDNPTLKFIANETLLNIPIPIIVFGVIAISMYIVFNKTVLGQWVYASGGNSGAATNAGINVNAVVAFTYILAAVLASIASLLVSSRLAGSVPGIGNLMLLDVLLAGLMSAIFSRLSMPNIHGAILSAIFVGMLTNGFTLIQVPTYWIYAIKGALILFAVTITTKQQRRLTSNG